MTDKFPLTNVHQALKDAALDRAKPDPMITGTYRIEEDAKAEAEKICAANGSTLSAFLRQCCHGLIRDYRPGIARE